MNELLHLDKLTKDDDTAPRSQRLLHDFGKEVELGGADRFALVAEDQPGIATDLAQAHERRQDGCACATLGVHLQRFLNVVVHFGQDPQVQRTLFLGHVGAQNAFDLGWQIFGDVFFFTAENDRLGSAPQLVETRAVAFGHGLSVAAFEVALGAQKTGGDEFENRPQLLDAVFDRSPGKREALITIDLARRFPSFRRGILHMLGFVHHEVTEVDFAKHVVDVTAQ